LHLHSATWEGLSSFNGVTFGNHHHTLSGNFEICLTARLITAPHVCVCTKPPNVLALEHVGRFLIPYMIPHSPHVSARTFLLPSSLIVPPLHNTPHLLRSIIFAEKSEVNLHSRYRRRELPAGPATKTKKKDMSLFAYPSAFWICCCRTPKENVLSVSTIG
jgi:hypothetical protein